MTPGTPLSTVVVHAWTDVVAALRRIPPGVRAVMVVKIDELPTPAAAGAVRSLGFPAGQFEDWRFPPEPDGAGLHVRRYEDRWIAHLDTVHPEQDLPGHLMRDAPIVWVGGATLGAAVVTYLGTRKPGLAFAAAALAYVVALATATERRRRAR